MTYFLEFASTSLAIATVAIALFLIQRSTGIPLLEIIPFATGVTLLLLSSMHEQSASTIHAASLLVPTIACGASVFFLQPWYARWRLRIAGESATLLLSFALMNVWLLLLSGITDARSTAIPFVDWTFVDSKELLELAVIVMEALFLIGVVSYIRSARLSAASQLAKDDYRLLESFGHRADDVKRHVLLVSAAVCIFGAFLFVALQDNFAVMNSYSILIPAFAISISQTRLNPTRLVMATFVLTACVQVMTQYTSELLRDFHQSLLFALFVVAGIISRWVVNLGLAGRLQRYAIDRGSRPTC